MLSMSKKKKALNQRSLEAQAHAAEASKNVTLAETILINCQAAHHEQLRAFAEEGGQVSAHPVEHPDLLLQLKGQEDCLRTAKRLHFSLENKYKQVRRC